MNSSTSSYTSRTGDSVFGSSSPRSACGIYAVWFSGAFASSAATRLSRQGTLSRSCLACKSCLAGVVLSSVAASVSYSAKADGCWVGMNFISVSSSVGVRCRWCLLDAGSSWSSGGTG